MPIGDGLIRLGTVLEGFGNEAEARRQLEFKERKTQATRDFYLQQQEFINEAESLGDSFDETALEDMKSRSRDAFKSRAQTLMDGLHPDRARAIEAEANQNAVITELTLERRATRAMVERLKVQGPESYEALVSPLNKNPGQIYSTLDAIEKNDANIADNVFDSGGNEVQVFSAAQRELLKKKGISEAYTTAFSGLLYGNSDGVIPRNGLAQAKQLLSDKASHIQKELGAEWVERYKGMIGSVEAAQAKLGAEVSAWEKAELGRAAERAAEKGRASLELFRRDNPSIEILSAQKIEGLMKRAQESDELSVNTHLAATTGARFEPNSEQRSMLDEKNKNLAQNMFASAITSGVDVGTAINQTIGSLNQSFGQGYLPKGSIQFLTETLLSPAVLGTIPPNQKQLLAENILRASYKDPDHKTPRSVMRDLQLVSDGYSPAEIAAFQDQFNAADPNKVKFETDSLLSRSMAGELSQFREDFMNKMAPLNIWGFDLFGGGDIDLPGIPKFRIGKDIVIPEGIESQIMVNAMIKVEQGMPAKSAYAAAFREMVMTEEHGNAILNEGSTARVVNDSPITKLNMGENAYKGVLMDVLIKSGESTEGEQKGWYDNIVEDDWIDNYDAVAMPALVNGKQFFRIVYSPLHPVNAGMPVTNPQGEPLIVDDFNIAEDMWSFEEVKAAHPDRKWLSSYRSTQGRNFDPSTLGGSLTREEKIKKWMEGEQVRTWRSDPSSRPIEGGN